jgi:hypothetical protein
MVRLSFRLLVIDANAATPTATPFFSGAIADHCAPLNLEGQVFVFRFYPAALLMS